jgi:hypothetical protein
MQLEWIVSKALAKNADDRYQHVDELIVRICGDYYGNSTKSTIGAHTAAAPQQRALQISPQESGY